MLFLQASQEKGKQQQEVRFQLIIFDFRSGLSLVVVHIVATGAALYTQNAVVFFVLRRREVPCGGRGSRVGGHPRRRLHAVLLQSREQQQQQRCRQQHGG